MEMVILLIIGVIILGVATGAFGRRRNSATEDGNPTHPRLKKCPGCGASVESSVDNCPQCGLRLSQ